MRIEATKIIAGSLGGTSAITGITTWLGWFNFINDNAPFFGVIISATTCFFYIWFYYVTQGKINESAVNKVVIGHLKIEIDVLKKELSKIKKEDE